MKKKKSALRRIGAIFGVILVAGVIAFAVFASGVLPYKQYAILTGSMNPSIPPTSLVIVGPGKATPGQVVAFREQDLVVVHRLVAINSDGTYTTKGDANKVDDPFITKPSEVVGVLKWHFNGLGFWLVFLKQPAALLAIGCLIAMLFLGRSIFNDLRESSDAVPTDEAEPQEEVSSVQVA